MKIAAAICNVVWLAFTCLVLATDGLPKHAGYVVATLLMLLTPLLTMFVILRGGAGDAGLGLHMKGKLLEEKGKDDRRSSSSPLLRTAAIVCNIALFGFIGWAFASQYPHPTEEGSSGIAFLLVSVVTPVLSLVALFGGRASGRLVPSQGQRIR